MTAWVSRRGWVRKARVGVHRAWRSVRLTTRSATRISEFALRRIRHASKKDWRGSNAPQPHSSSHLRDASQGAAKAALQSQNAKVSAAYLAADSKTAYPF